ncbi:MAG: hypothetical protein WB797_04300 [Nocardioides sp.]
MTPDPEILGSEPVRLEPRRRTGPDAGDEPRLPSRPMPRWQRVTLAVAAVGIATGWYVDHRVAHHESASLERCDAHLRSVSRVYDTRMDSMFEYIRPSLSLGTRANRRLVSRLMAQPARRVLPSATATRARCRQVRVLPWHSSNVAHRDTDLAYAAALVQRLETVAGHQVDFRAYDPHLARLRAAAGIPVALGP